MRVTVYIDILFLSYFLICESILFWIAAMSREKVKISLWVLAGVEGSIGAIITTLWNSFLSRQDWLFEASLLNSSLRSICALLGVLCMLKIAFWRVKFCTYKRLVAYFVVASALYAGILTFGYDQKENSGRISMFSLLVKSAFFLLTIPFARFLCEKYRYRQTKMYEIILEKNGVTQKGIGLLDTGNQLYHPRTGEPVVVAQHSFLKPFFEEEEYRKQEKMLNFELCEYGEKTTIVWIPYHTVGKSNGILPGMYFDCLKVECEGKQKENRPILVAFCKEKISIQGEYQMILHCNCV